MEALIRNNKGCYWLVGEVDVTNEHINPLTNCLPIIGFRKNILGDYLKTKKLSDLKLHKTTIEVPVIRIDDTKYLLFDSVEDFRYAKKEARKQRDYMSTGVWRNGKE